MASSTAYSYSNRNIFDIQTLIQALKFSIINLILAIIFLFLIFEEIDWAIFSYEKNLNDKVIDNTSWNLKTIF